MKRLISTFLKTTSGCVLLSVAATVSAQTTGFYFKGDLGGTIPQDVDVKEFLGAVLPDYKLKLDPGFRLGLGAGYQFVDWASVEIESGFMGHEVNTVTGATYVHDAFYGNVPFLFNGRLQLPMGRCPVIPYVGAGVGFAATWFDVDVLEFRDAVGDIYGISGSDSDTVFAWQAFAGLRYAINERMGLGVEYRFFEADGPSFEADFHGFYPYSNTIKFGKSQTHVISLAFDFHF